MAGIRDREKRHFPLQQIQDVVNLFKDQFSDSDEPNLAFLSIVLGSIEHILTVNRAVPYNRDASKCIEPIFPVIQLDTIQALFTKFVTLVKSSVDLTQYPGDFATRELVKRVSDVIWSGLTRAYYKDKAHLQSLYSFLTGNKLDCFGVAFGVVAAFQVLGYKDVHLALSEDHAWVVFGKDLKETAEVTWHGKGNEDKRGQPITVGVSEKNWLYLNGQPVICSREIEVAAIVSAINPSINATTDSVEMGALQQELLWQLYDMGHLDKYPMALGNLGDLEELCPTLERPLPVQIFDKAIESAKTYYNEQHVYPYTYLGAYHCRKGNYREALKAWADAASVIKKYNYTREDEEIYKEFLEIANDLLPNMMKSVAGENASRLHGTSLLHDPEAYANFLRFYDGICQWEEDSPTPVLHITWAKQLVFSLGKFDPKVRNYIDIHGEGEEDEEEEEEDEEEEEEEDRRDLERKVPQKEVTKGRKRKRSHKNSENGDEYETKDCKSEKRDIAEECSTNSVEHKLNGQQSDEEQIKSAIEELVSKVGEESQSETSNPNIAALAQACSESILNPDYLLTGGEPFMSTSTTSTMSVGVESTRSESRLDVKEFLSNKSNGTPFMGMTVDSMLKAESPADMMMYRKRPDSAVTTEHSSDTNASEPLTNETEIGSEVAPETVSLMLQSHKMKGLRKLLLSEKLNTSAIMLQLTAQSQVFFKPRRKSTDTTNVSLPRKRTRRE
ncbi:hypothetical protein ACJMK2_038045 [Sinanodonta woodiana]|uniref:Menin n=1 Tax=Sinanodonta woodiana TaxID=1069815 RepID=A0ABD3WP55_SINWO